MKKIIFLIILFGVGIYYHHTSKPVIQAAGVLAPNVPVQTPVENIPPFVRNAYQITPIANFALKARVLGAKRYFFGRNADLSPVDLALGWGPMSDSAVLERIDISQSNRFYHWYVREFPIPRHDIERNSANMHMIPANETIAKRLAQVREGQIIALKGYLINIRAEDGWHWYSSTTRNDTGFGACEVIWVESFDILDLQKH